MKRNSTTSYLAGTAHFFTHSFRPSLTGYLRGADTVLFEGPLDKASMDQVVAAGMTDDADWNILDELDGETIREISSALIANCKFKNPYMDLTSRLLRVEDPVYAMVKGMKPWLAFFTLWSTFLKNQGWHHSVDSEGYGIALELGKPIVFLETIEEQIKVLEKLARDRIIAFLKRIKEWPDFSRAYAEAYLSGDLHQLKTMGLGFPSRHENVIDHRDQIFYDRMADHLRRGNAVAFVGAPHLRGLKRIMEDQGFRVLGPPFP